VAVLRSDELPPILVRPVGAGRRRGTEEYYIIDPYSGAPTRINESLVPQTQLEADGGGKYLFRQQNGWIVDVRHIFRPKEEWIAQSVGNDIQVETPSLTFRVLEDEIQIRVRIVGLIGRYVVTSARRNFIISGWFWFPWHLTWFTDGYDQEQCMPFTDLLCTLRDSRQAKRLASQWAMGIHCISTAFEWPQKLQWSDGL